MKKHKKLIISIISIIIILIVGITLFLLLRNKNRLTIKERNWIDDNINNIQNINVKNNVNIFGKDGIGVFYDFLEDFEKEYNLKINPITYNDEGIKDGISFGLKTKINDQDIVIHKDHYVLISKSNEIINNNDDLIGKNIGVLSNNLQIITNYLSGINGLTFSQYETKEAIKEALLNGEINYIVCPLVENLNDILKNEYHIIYHFSDINKYYTISLDDSILSQIIEKYYNKWNKTEEYYNLEQFKLFVNSLNITDTEIDTLRSVEHKYGFVNTSPYEIITGGKYGGIVAVYLSKFSNFSGIDFKFTKYKNYDKFIKAVKNKEMDIYFNYYNFKDDYHETKGIPINYIIATNRKNNLVINSINSLKNKTVYVYNNSLIGEYLKNIEGIKLETYDSFKKLKKLNKKDIILVIDENIFNYYQKDRLDNYIPKYTGHIKNEYRFKTKNDSALYKLLNKYIESLDSKEIIYEGLNNHYEVTKNGSFLSNLAEYILALVFIVVIIVLIIIRKSRKITIAKKIKKEDKLKFIDQLTSLKNRNFLNENISIWNNNTIYPQAIVVINLNKIQDINDQYGYEEGDKQIKAAAGVLVKTQLDNSEIMRTDGNEFVIYLVGYSQKQVTNYIHKLNKELNKLPYEYGSEFGYSMILDNIKTIEDALNESMEDMKKQKSDSNEKQNKK